MRDSAMKAAATRPIPSFLGSEPADETHDGACRDVRSSAHRRARVVLTRREDYALGHDRFEDVSELHRRCPAGGDHGSGRVKGNDA